MESLDLFFEASPLWLIPALFVAAGLSYILYQRHKVFTSGTKKLLGAIRFLTLFIILILLISPVLKSIINQFEKPVVILAIDNSSSIKLNADTAMILNSVNEMTDKLSEKYEVILRNLDEGVEKSSDIRFINPYTDLSEQLSKVRNTYENRNLASIILVSDGVYNRGLNPVYAQSPYPIYTIGVGDTTQYTDLAITQLRYNKLSYQGNKIPIQINIDHEEFNEDDFNITLSHNGEEIRQKTIDVKKESGNVTETFLIDANEKGMQRYVVNVSSSVDERNSQNNIQSAYIDVVEGKKKILIMAPYPHPDIKAMEAAITENQNYEVIQYIPPLNINTVSEIINQPYDLVIMHQLPHRTMLNDQVFKKFSTSSTSRWWITGASLNTNRLNQLNNVLTIRRQGSQNDNITPYFNTDFGAFKLSEELKELLNDLPPVTVPFGQMDASGTADVFLYQQVGRVQTSKPLFLMQSIEDNKTGIFLGDNLYRWRLYEYNRYQEHQRFNELIQKTVQYLSTKEDKRLFRFYPVKNEFTNTEAVTFRAETYNDLYEEIYGQRIALTISSDNFRRDYQFVTAPNKTEYTITGLPEGIFQYQASTTINEKTFNASGEFVISDVDLESTQLVANYNLLREVSQKSGGSFYNLQDNSELIDTLINEDYKPVIQSSEDFIPLINLKWIAMLILALISIEWIIRKYQGAY